MAPVRLVSQRSKPAWLLSKHRSRLVFSIASYGINGLAYSSQASPQQSKIGTKSPYRDRLRAKEKDREFFESVLGASTTKRDAKAFLSRFGEKPKSERQSKPVAATQNDTKVNLGALYSPNRAVETSPVFSFKDAESQFRKVDRQVHAVVVKVRNPQLFDDDTLEGVAKTLGQLAKLGVISIVVVDMDPSTGKSPFSAIQEQSRRLSDAILANSDSGVRIVDQALEVAPDGSAVDIKLKHLLFNPLRKGMISIIPPLAISDNFHVEAVQANDIVVALSSQLPNSKQLESEEDKTQSTEISVDRIIFLDQTGGIPDPLDSSRTQPFVNIEQEYDTMTSNLSGMSIDSAPELQKSLNCLRQCLSILPESASALLTTPEEVAASALQKNQAPETPGVGTRRRRNRLIHNILTNKPIVSASLPLGRLQSNSSSNSSRYRSTFFKHGMPVLMVPDPSQNHWTGPLDNGNYLRLENNPRIDFRKLIHLMEDSFGRPLDVEHYLKRIENHVAGVIIAGDYEGGAILTWEDPPGRPGRPPVPYLDKFAVLRRSQGSGGVADIVFNAMVRNCFPNGVVWRSRRDNPVNKWYFERATGTLQIPGTKWTMFWTGSSIDFHGAKDLTEAEERWKDYVAVCGNIKPSWADGKKPD